MARQAVLGDKAYRALREAIAKGTLRPNQRLVEAELSDRFGLGRTPIRTSLKMLEDQGLVIKERSSWTVRDFGPEDIRNVYQVRIALEGYAARLAAQVASDDELAAIENILTRHGDDLATLPHDAQVDLNAQFHGAIASASGNPHLVSQIERNQQFHFDFYTARLWTHEEYQEGHGGHLAIAQALRDRDPEAAERLAREHYQFSMDTLLAKLM